MADIRVQLRRDHDIALQELEALRAEKDERRCRDRLERLRLLHKLEIIEQARVA